MKRDYRNPKADLWYKELCQDLSAFPFSFGYGQKRINGFPSELFSVVDETTETVGDKETKVLTLKHNGTLYVKLKISHYYSHGVTEWTVFFENKGEENSLVISSPETKLNFEGKLPVLKGILGDHANKYTPYSIDLQNDIVEYTSTVGRATHYNFPYFNLEYGDGGVMLAIGWAGTWQASFGSDGENTVYTASSVNKLKTYLKPGETIRTALFVVAPYTKRNEHYATNFWRSWFVECNLPKADKDGTPLAPFSTCCFASDTGLPNSDGSISENKDTWRPTMKKMIQEDTKVDFRWVDAGWYVCPDGSSPEPYVKGHDWWDTVGTWTLDPAKWPDDSFLESTEEARKNGMRTLMWFEPERVTDPENLAKNYGYDASWAIRVDGERAISNNIGDPACLKWTTDRICDVLRKNKVEMYREDNNCNAAALWRHLDTADGEDRQGITECKFIAGHYKMWDDIIACTQSYGGCGFVDSCASGGGRNDLESMRRGVPLLRSDADRTSTALRLSMTSTFNKWIPFNGANTKEKLREHDATGTSDPYVWRASYLCALNVDSQFVCDPDQDFGILRKGLREWKKVNPYLLKEFYPLTPWRSEANRYDFTSYAYFDPDTEAGVLFAFRQENCNWDELKLKLPFIEKGEKYVFTDADNGEDTVSGGELSLVFPTPRSAKLLYFKKEK